MTEDVWATMREAALTADEAQLAYEAASREVYNNKLALHNATQKSAAATLAKRRVISAQEELDEANTEIAQLMQRLHVATQTAAAARRIVEKAGVISEAARTAQEEAATLGEALWTATQGAALAASRASEAGERFGAVALAAITERARSGRPGRV